MRTRMKKMGALIGVLALLVAACGNGDDPAPETPEETAAPDPGDDDSASEEQEADTDADADAVDSDVSFDLRMGTIVPLTGDQAVLGPGYGEATEMATDLINESLERLGLTDQISVELVSVEDDQTQASAAVEAATKLVQVDNVDVIFGSVATSSTIPIAESVTIPNEIVLISMGSTGPQITDLDDNDYVWRTVPSAATQGLAIADLLEREFGADAVVNTGARNDDFSVSLVELFERAWTERGNTINERVRWNPDAQTYDTEAAQLVAGDPDAWVLIDFPEGWGRMGPALVRTGAWDPEKTYTAQSLQTAELVDSAGPEATIGMRGTAPASEAAEAFPRFVEVFDERVSSDSVTREGFAPYAFDGPFYAFLAALRGGSSEPSVIRDNLRAVSGETGGTQYSFDEIDEAITALLNGEEIHFVGAGGPTEFDENGDPGVVIFQEWGFVDGGLEVFGLLE